MIQKVELPKNAVLFNNKQAWKEHEAGLYIRNSPDSFPCWGWEVADVETEDKYSVLVYAFVYPESEQSRRARENADRRTWDDED